MPIDENLYYNFGYPVKKENNTGVEKYFSQYADLEQKLVAAGYGDLVGANYWNKLTYKPGLLDNIGSVLGMRTGYDQFWENASMQYGEYLSGLAQKMYNEQYDSPSAQAARMRQAGQNPDLLGTGDVAGAAAMPEDTNNQLPQQQPWQTSLAEFSSTMFNCFSGALGLVQDVQAIRAAKIANEAGDIGNADRYVDFAKKLVLEYTPALGEGIFDRATIEDSIWNSFDANYNPSIKGISGRSDSPLSKKEFRKVRSSLQTLISSMPTQRDQFQGWLDEMKSKRDVATGYGSKYFSPDFNKMRTALQPLIDVQDEITRLSAEFTKENVQYTDEYYQQMNDLGAGSAIAQSDLQVKQSAANIALSQEQIARLNALVENARTQVIQNFSELAKQGDDFANVMLFLYSFGSMTNLGGTISTLASGLKMGF